MWVLVKIMVTFWVLTRIRHLMFKKLETLNPGREPKFENTGTAAGGGLGG